MPKQTIAQEEILQDKTWLQKELTSLRTNTLMLVVVAFSVLGVLIGYYLFSDVFGGAFKNVTFAATNDSAVKIEWETNFPARTKVEYGTSEFYLNETNLTSEYDMEHDIEIGGLLPDKDHVFRLIAEDDRGNKHMSDFYKVL